MKRLHRQLNKVFSHVTNQFEKIREVIQPGSEWNPAKSRQLERIATLFLKLPDKEREAMTLKWFENGRILDKPKKNVEVAKLMGIKPNAVDQLIYKAIRKMKKK